MICESKHRIRIPALLISLAIPLLVGGFSAYLTSTDMKAYETLEKPLLAPPGWLFPIAWTILYILLGVASYLIYTAECEPERKRTALLFYAAQLGMNLFWSTLFFTYANYLVALIWLIAMWGLIIVCVIKFFKISRTAGIMMCVLLAWTTFAAYLNLACYLMSIA